ncbi:MAG: hypothetical protein ACE37F_15820 [Nannocystaceae bacterium]|nr:hypothetical protein [bacterium]
MRVALPFIALCVVLAGCRGDVARARPLTASLTDALPEAPSADLLARARASVRDGAIDPAMRAALAASALPRDRRAARMLAALEAPAPPEEPAAEPTHGEFGEAPRIKLGTAPPRVPARPAKASATAPRAAAAPASTTRSAAPPSIARARLEKLAMSTTKKGASLSLRGSGGLVVGVASQPRSGIVRLVMDAEASAGALRARPKISGARVTGIRRTGKTVFVTLSLDPGWSLRGIVRTRAGARVDLNRPA